MQNLERGEYTLFSVEYTVDLVRLVAAAVRLDRICYQSHAIVRTTFSTCRHNQDSIKIAPPLQTMQYTHGIDDNDRYPPIHA